MMPVSIAKQGGNLTAIDEKTPITCSYPSPGRFLRRHPQYGPIYHLVFLHYKRYGI